MKSMSYYLLRREWLQYRSFGKSWLLVWAIYLGLYLLMGISASFVITFLPIIMTYSAVYTVKQAGEAVALAPRTSCCRCRCGRYCGPATSLPFWWGWPALSWWSAPYCCASC